jgi:eukaryotic-like serine/threonine-protein kinase
MSSAATATTFGQYELIERLACGGMAELYKARVIGAHGFEKPIVVKRILPHLAQDPQFVAMFIDEAKITARLSHPKIVQVLALGTEGDQPFIAMEFIDGMDVLGLLRQCKRSEVDLPAELAVFVAHEVLDALDYAHQALDVDGKPLGIVHRDISPGNVLMSRRGDVKLADFGIARAVERQHRTATGTLKGKYGYMSPEQIAGKPLDGRSDLFSVGVMLAELLMMRRLFVAPSDLDVLLMVRDVDLHRFERYGGQIPADLRDIALRALSREPDDRFFTAGDFRDALADWLYGRGKRINSRTLARFVDNLRSGDAENLAETRMVDPDEVPSDGTISGPSTHARKLAAEEAARIGRQRFASHAEVSESSNQAIPQQFEDDPSDIIIVEAFDEGSQRTELAPPPIPAPEGVRPTGQGTFEQRSPINVLFRLAVDQATGLLRVERDAVVKEAYFEDGHPSFVRSNVLDERLGEYLVANRVISRPQLERALEVLPHFGDRLGATLVGLKLMRPVDAFHHLTGQVRAKMVDVCQWSVGSYQWFHRYENPWPALPLHLDTFEILGAGAMSLSREVIGRWAREVALRRPVTGRLAQIELQRFGLGQKPQFISYLLDGKTSVRGVVERFSSSQDQLDVLRILYLLIESECARFE